jgi:hypothetical protein
MDNQINSKRDPFLDVRNSGQNEMARESWGNMAQRLYTDVSNLVEREGQLIRTEIVEKTTQLKSGIVSLVSAGVVLFLGVLCLAATSIILLDYLLPLGWAAFLVSAVFLMVGGVIMGRAKKKMDAGNLLPRKSMNAISEISVTLKEKANEITKH